MPKSGVSGRCEGGRPTLISFRVRLAGYIMSVIHCPCANSGGRPEYVRFADCSLEGAGSANRRLGVSDALADPMVQALMAADGIDPRNVMALMRRTAARLAIRSRWGLRSPSTVLSCDLRR